MIAELRGRGAVTAPLVAGGRSLGARVRLPDGGRCRRRCRPLPRLPGPPAGKADDPAKSRQGELDAVAVPVLVVQGTSDPFGMPPGGPKREVVTVAGNHGLKADLPAVGEAVAAWLAGLAV